MEVAWEALENGGVLPSSLSGSLTGVFIGIGNYDYGILLSRDLDRINAYDGTGNTLGVAANRLSYLLNLRGPSLAIETACSSSLVAIHLACRSLQNAETDLCLVGAVSLMLSPEQTITYSQARMMASDGRCKTFDASADGYVRGEGCGIVVLKRLSDAIRDGDNIQAVIRGSAINQDGLSNGLTAPNGPSQQTVIRQALENAGVEPAQISYVEAHGTGTSLGDPIEIKSLKAVLMQGRSSNQPCWIGAVKTNIGHLEAAAGMAGLLKVVLSLQQREIPPHLNLKQLNPYISLEGTPFAIPTEIQPWTTGTKHRFAGISSFGFGGTNGHVILEEAPAESGEGQGDKGTRRPLHLLTLSAKSEPALRELAQRYEGFLASHSELSLADVCFTANTGRSHFEQRLAVVAESTMQLRQQLEAFAAQQETAGLVSGQVHSSKRQKKIAFLFTGQGSQYVGMGRQLYEQAPTFRQTLDRCDEILRPYLEKPLLEVLYPAPGETSPLDETAYTQPALFALEYALAQLWQSWGIEPAVVMGHSVGEYVAACVAGVFSLEDGLKLIAERGRLMQSLTQEGDMVSLLATEAQVAAAIQPYEEVSIAAINGPESVVISGKRQAVKTICADLEAKGVKTKPLTVSHAFHSPLMEPMLADFERVAKEVTYSPPRLRLISNVTGLGSEEIATPEYWCRHVRQPVRFAAGMETLHQQGYEIFVEIGPKPILLGMGRYCLPEEGRVWLPSLRPGQLDWQQMLQSLAELYVLGVRVDWSGFDRDYPRRRLPLPTYPFQRQRYWVETAEVDGYKTRLLSRDIQSKILHPLLGQRLHSALKEIQFESQISQESPAFLEHHRIYQTAIVPATAYIEMALAAGANAFKSDQLVLEEVFIQQSLMLPEDEGKTLQLILSPEGTTAYAFQIFSFNLNEENEAPVWTLHASGKVRVEDISEPPQAKLADLQAEVKEEISVETCYQQFRNLGMEYGSSFQAIEQLWQQEGKVLGLIRLPEALVAQAGDYNLHPVLVDASFQMLGAALLDDNPDAYLPVGLKRLQVYRRAGIRLWSQSEILQVKDGHQETLTADVSLFDESGAMVAKLEGLSLRRASRQALLRSLQKDLENWLYRVTWQPKIRDLNQPPVEPKQPGSWLIFTEDGSIGLKLAKRLKKQGEHCILVSAGQAYEKSEGEHYRINPVDPLDFQRLFQDIAAAHQPPYRGVVHLWTMKKTPEDSLTALQEAQVIGCGSVLNLVQSLAQSGWSKLPRLWLVTRGVQPVETAATPPQVQHASLWGLGRVIALEHPDLYCTLVDLEPSAEQDGIQPLWEELWFPEREDQVAYRQGMRHVARLVRHKSLASGSQGQLLMPSEAFQLKISSYGILENLTLVPMTRRQPEPGEVEIQVRAVGLNFRDVLNALGMLKEYIEQMGIESATDLPFGGECAGTIVSVGENVSDLKVGDAVIAAQALGSLSSFVTVRAEFVVPKPQQLSFEAAATIPTTFLTAYYGLHTSAKIQPGDRVLIHAAAGGVGQAAVQLAQRAGAEVLATASPGKWEFLKSVGVEQVMNSRTLDFAEEVMAITKGLGVDIVLNSLNGEFIPKSLEVLGKGGRFVEIGKIGIWEERQMQEKRPDAAYFPFDLLDISTSDPGLIASMLGELMQEFRQGTLKPLPFKVFPIDNVVDAFRHMARAKHIGKVVVSLPAMEMGADSPDRKQVRGDSSYLITGGLGALGLKLAHWMIEQGARYLVLTGRRDASKATQEVISHLEQSGAQVLVVKTDVSQQEDVAKMLEVVQSSMPPLRGIVHAAGVLDDGVLLQQNWERFARVMAPKVEGTWNLHALTQNLPLDFFVCFSSVAALLGSPGQGNYAAANAFMDVLIHHRRALGLPGLSINWGPWANAGMAAELGSREQARLAAQGMNLIAPEQGFQVLGDLLEQGAAQVGVLPVNWSKFLQQFPQSMVSPLLEAFTEASEQSLDQSELLQQLEAAPASERRTLLTAHIRSQIAKVLGLTSEQIEPRQRLFDLGLDSLMAIELKNQLEANLGQSLRSTLMFDYPTVEALVDYLALEVLLIESAESNDAELTQEDEELNAFLAEIDQISDNEIRQQLTVSKSQN